MGEHMFDTELFEFPPPSFDEWDLKSGEWELIDLPPESGYSPKWLPG